MISLCYKLILSILLTTVIESYRVDKSAEVSCDSEYCSSKAKRYILYDVNPGEGFNLRRDIFIRIAPLVQSLNKQDKQHEWVLVLPPWGRLPHWKYNEPTKFYPWSIFFNLDNIREYIPVIELDDYLEEYGWDNNIDIVYQLQHFPFNSLEEWTEKIETGVKCESYFGYKMNDVSGLFSGYFWERKILSREAACMALRGQASTLKPFLLKSKFRAVMFDKAEVILWDSYGGPQWWAARKSLQFSKALVEHAKDFLITNKLSLPTSTNIISSSKINYVDLSQQYIGVHLRRADFLAGRASDLPSLEGAAKQIVELLTKLNLMNVFVASDATKEEVEMLTTYVLKLSENFKRSVKILQYDCRNLSEGECAIIDQIMCSWSAYFVGTTESTFSFRIFEEREILQWPSETTFNSFCPDDPKLKCKRPTKWTIR